MAKDQVCSTEGCGKPAAFTTRSKPAWCTDCLTGILAELDLVPLGDFPGQNERWLTCCRNCGGECHYLLKYLLELRTRDEPACRRCYWTAWAEHANKMAGGGSGPVGVDELRQMLDRKGFDPVEPLVPLPSANHPVITRCRLCGRQEAKRPGEFNCTCTRNAAPQRPKPAARAGKTKNLLIDSGHPALTWWDHEANSEADLQTVTLRAHRVVQWACPECSHRFTRKVLSMTGWLQCPKCEEARSTSWAEEREQLKRTAVSAVPELLDAWADDADPSQVMVAGDWQLRRFKCRNGHYARVNPSTYLSSGCQFCRGQSKSPKSRPTLAQELPEIAAQWHPTRNGTKHTPENVVPDSKRTVWWLADCCGYEWEEQVRSRNKNKRQRCPQCRTILDSLAWYDPGLAAEWSPENPVTPWQIRPTAQTSFVPKWVCSVEPEHRWEAALAVRSNGSECPECRQSGKSRVELDHLEAAKKVFTKVRSGAPVRDKAFARRWTIDILATLDDRKIAIEYDGAYWHAPEGKRLTDRRKSLDLLSAGYLVVRLREDDLPTLGIDDERYLEMPVFSTAPRPDAVIAEVLRWAEDRVLSGKELSQ
ncbi:zinc-ribbon domain-containing protein [Crystallibacter degradans]|uniref:zinc-ribbon domain-containing protein n=1 Tax=Crystallibacter degradans TaxID=2726743 RepID=UPI00147661AD|nr:zinc-ribbon domain-containing protein [Arthrobacter sp. SF27]NMR30918.1 zinc-ribbon domain-containing protein [Arthrobacter sp. SF27]